MSGFEEARSALEKAFQDEDLSELVGSSERIKSFLANLRCQGEEIIESTLCPRVEYPQWTKPVDMENKPAKLHNLDCTLADCPNCGIHKIFGVASEIIQESSTPAKEYAVKLWKYQLITNTAKNQKELVEESMNIKDLFQHFMKCLATARHHYVYYKIVDCAIDLFKYKGLRDKGRAVVEADFAATPDLCAHQIATGQVMTHAVIEPFILHEDVREEGGTTTCTKTSHIYIGGAKGEGKNSTWRFHIACVHDLIDRVQARRLKEGRVPLRELDVITDRCSGQFLF